MNYFLYSCFLLLFLCSCSSKKNIATNHPVAQGLRVETLLPGPAPHLSIGYGLTMGQTNFRPFAKSVADQATGIILSLKVDEQGFIEADCYGVPDTIRIVQHIAVPVVSSPCPKPEKPVYKRFSLVYLLLAFTAGYVLNMQLKGVNAKKNYDRFKDFISRKLRR